MRLIRLLVLAGCLAVPAYAQERMPPIPADKLTDEQKQAQAGCAAAETNAKAAYGGSYGRPIATDCKSSLFDPLLRSPELMLTINAMRDYVQYHPALPCRIRELAIEIAGRDTRSSLVYDSHYQLATRCGLSAAVLKAVADGRRPTGMSDDEATAYDFLDELHRNRSVGDAVYAKAIAEFGERGVIDLTGVYAWYSLWATMHQVATKPPAVPEGCLDNAACKQSISTSDKR